MLIKSILHDFFMDKNYCILLCALTFTYYIAHRTERIFIESKEGIRRPKISYWVYFFMKYCIVICEKPLNPWTLSNEPKVCQYAPRCAITGEATTKQEALLFWPHIPHCNSSNTAIWDSAWPSSCSLSFLLFLRRLWHQEMITKW